MIPRVELGRAVIPGRGGELRLVRRGDEYLITLHNNELMSSRVFGSEEALARLGCGGLEDRPRPRVLVGGLGMGFTLRAALVMLPAEAELIVAELVPEVVAWAEGPLAPLFGDCLADPRVRLEVGDVAGFIAAPASGYDAILLDVDNGPDGLSRPGNDRLYDAVGLGAIRRALRSAGKLAVWSTAPSAPFVRRLKAARFDVEEHVVRSRGDRGARHIIWLARPR